MSILVQYVNDVLTPTPHQFQFIKLWEKSIRKVFSHNSSLASKEVYLGGSLAKGTMLKYNLDADIVFLYNKSEEDAIN